MAWHFRKNKMGASSSKNSKVITFRSSSTWKDHLEESKRTSKLMVINFSASWCGFCRYMEPIINEFSTKFPEVEFIKIDVQELLDVAKEFGVRAMPTFVLMKNGKEVDKLLGADAEELERMINKHKL